MTTLSKLDAAINNAELNSKPEVAAALRMFRDGVTALEKDRERLDWLEQAGRKNSVHDPDKDWFVRFSKWNVSLRAAIDTAKSRP